MKKFARAMLVYCLVISLMTPFSVLAAPLGGNVVAGNATIAAQGVTTTINQTSNKAIINWQGFDISANELVRFLQPSASSIALNRVIGGNATQILGQLSSNGRLFIINPNGIVFGSMANIDVSGLLASTLSIKDADFLNNRFEFTQVGSVANATVENRGTIKIGTGGFAFLVAPGVKNEGLIVAKLGEVMLASGNRMTIDFRGDSLISYAVSGAVADQVTGMDGQALTSLVSNTGTINASGGHVLMQGAALGDVFASVVNNGGSIVANSLQNHEGKITLSGGAGAGTVVNTGTLDVSAASTDTQAGTVAMSGYFVGNSGTIKAEGRGTGNGGLVSMKSEQQAIAASTSKLIVSGGTEGNGGTVLLRSGSRVTFDGQVVAQGGALRGDGGFVDVSSPGTVELFGTVDAFSATGKTGTLLIDPSMIDINAVGGAAYNAALNQFAAAPVVATIITPASINASLANVVLQAHTDITVSSAIAMTGLGIGITLQAGRSILVNQSITTNNGAIVLSANDRFATAANRLAGLANITMAVGTTINAGTANIAMTVDSLGVLGAGNAGGIQVDSVTTSGNLTMTSFGAITEIAPDAAVDLRANIMTLTTTDAAGATIGSPGTAATDPLEILVGTQLDITTTNGAVAIHSPGSSLGVPNFIGVAPVDNPATTKIDESMLVDLSIGSINIGTATLIATVTDGAFLDATAGAGATPNITAGGINLVTNGGVDILVNGQVAGNNGVRGGSIGTAVNPLRTKIGILTASSSNQSIYIDNTSNAGVSLLINKVIAMQEGVAAQNSGTVVTAKTIDGTVLTGINDVVINSTGDVVVDTVSATRTATLNSGGLIYDNNQAANNFTAKAVVLSAAGVIGQVADAIEIVTEDLSATTANGGQYYNITIPTTISTITAGGAASDVTLKLTQGVLTLGTITTTGGVVTIDAGQGSLADGNGAAVNILGASAVLTAGGGIGSAADLIETTVTDLTVDVSSTTATSFYIAETDGLNSINAKVKQGDTNLTLLGGSFAFTASTGLLASTGIANVTFENTGGDIAIGTLNATALGAVTVTALGAINSSTSAITASSLTLTAGKNIGSALAAMNTTVATATLNATAGGIYVREADALTVSATAGGTASDIDIATALALTDLTLGNINATGTATLNSGGSILASAPSTTVAASSIAFTAGGAIGVLGTPLLTKTASMTATSGAGAIALSNTGDLTLSNAVATGGALELTNSGALVLGVASAVGNAVTITNSGAITDSNAALLNITGSSLTISGSSIGATGAAMDVDVATLTASTTTGAIVINSVGGAALNLLSATAIGANAGIDITAAGDVALGMLTAKGDAIILSSTAGAITDANGANLNVIGKSMTINALNGVGVGNSLETQVSQMSSSANTNVSNVGPLLITQTSLQSGGSSFTADSITIADMGGAIVAMPVNASLNLTTTVGHIVFLNANDTIVASGTGFVDIKAGTTAGSGAVAVIGNITTAGTNISISADSHISIGLLNAGTGNVSLISSNGSLLDSNGAANNIIAANVTMRGTVQSARNAQLATINAIALANAKTSETAATLTNLDSSKAALVLQTATSNNLAAFATTTASAASAADAAANAADNVVIGLQTGKFIADGVVIALSAAAVIVGTVAGIAQAIPFTGDGGLATAAAILDATVVVASAVSLGLDVGMFIASQDAGTKGSTADVLNASSFAANQDAYLAVQTVNAANESISIIQKAYDDVVIARDSAWQVSNQAVLAENTLSTAGTLVTPFGIQATGRIDISATNSDAVLSLTGAAILGDISATKAVSKDAFVSIKSNNNLTVAGALITDNFVRLETTGTINGTALGSITAGQLAAIAGTGVGNLATLNTSVNTIAVNAGTGGVAVSNNKALTIATVDGVVGISATTAVNVASANGLTVSNNVASTAGAVVLTAGTNAATVDDLSIGAGVAVNGVAGVTLTAGDNIALATGSQLTGTTVAITADNVTDGFVDGVTGSITLAGNINGSVVTISGGGVNQTGAIVSTGLVNIAANSTATSAISGITLASIQAGTTIDVVSNRGLTLNKNVQSTGVNAGAITLTAGTNVATVDDLTIGAVTVGTTAAVTMTAGDNITTALGSIINGSVIAMTADNVGDGNLGDTVSGSLALAGAINGTTSVSIVGGGVNHTGTITSGGLVNITASSTAASPFNGISLATITATGAVTATSSNALAVTSNISSTGAVIALLAGTNTGTVDSITIDAVTLAAATGVSLTAGDNISTAAGSQITGTAITMIADNAGDGFADGVSGGLTLAGNMSGSSVNITGGGLNQTGSITSTGLVNIATTSTAASPITGATLALIQAGTTIDVVSNRGLTLNKNVQSTGVNAGAITLTAGTNVATVDNLTIGAVTVGTTAAVTMTAGDNIDTAVGSQINGAAIALTANNAGGLTLAGNMSGSSVNITGGGLNQTGSITSTGLVNIATTSTAASSITGATLALIQAGTTIDVVSNRGLTLNKNVQSTGVNAGAITLIAGTNAATVDNLTIGAVTVGTTAAVTMTAGDNIDTAVGSQINGAAIALTANNAGGLTLAGNMSGSSVNITGGGLNQTGSITSTGLVNIATTSAAASSITGATLALIQAGTTIDVLSNRGLTLNQNVQSTAGAITLTAGTNAATVDNLTIGAVTVGTTAAVTMTAGDNIDTAVGSQINGAAIALTANNAGGLTLAGNMSGSSVNITGGGLNQTGSITSTGLVNIATTSTAASPITGATLALIQAGTTIDVVSNRGLTLNQNVQSTAGAITLTAGTNAATVDNLTIGAVTVGTTAAVTMTAGDNITTALGSIVNGAAIAMTADNVGDGIVDGATGSLTLAGAMNGSSININGGGLNHTGVMTSTGLVNIATVSTATSTFDGIALGTINALGQTVNVSATGTPTAAILDNNDTLLAPVMDIQAANLSLVAAGGVGTALNPLELTVARLAASGGTGGVALANAGALTLGTVGVVNSLTATAGAITLKNAGAIAISDGFVQGAGLNVTLLSAGGSITEILPGLAADVVGLNVSLGVTGVGSTIGTLAQRLELDAGVLNASTQGGSMYLTDTLGGLAVNSVTTGGVIGSVVDLQVNNGSLTQAAGLFPNLPHIQTDSLNVAVTGVTSTIGAPAQFLTVDVNTLKNITTQGGSIYMVDTAGGVAIDSMSTLGVAGSEVALISLNGSILESTPADLAVDVFSDIINLQVNAPNTNIGTAAEPLELDGNTITLSNLFGARSFTAFPNATPANFPVVVAPVVPSNLMVSNGQVIGGSNIAKYIEAQSTIASPLSASMLILGQQAALGGLSQSNSTGSNLIGSGSGYWGLSF